MNVFCGLYFNKFSHRFTKQNIDFKHKFGPPFSDLVTHKYTNQMMKLATLCVMLICGLFNCACSPNPTYTSKYDNVDLDEVLASERLLTGYMNCLMDLGPCTPDGKELKTNLPDAIANDCKSCTERQRDGADKVMHHLIDNRSGDWDKLEQKYKSDGSYKRRYLEEKLSRNKSLEEGSMEGTCNGTNKSVENNE